MSPFSFAQRLLPKRLISSAAGMLARIESPSILKNQLIRWFIAHYGVDMSEAARTSPGSYSCFEDFFTRELKPSIRPQPCDRRVISCPVDGTVSACGLIAKGTLVSAKGHDYSVSELMAADSSSFEGGTYATFYLAPRDYHRVHVPTDAELEGVSHVPGALFSVNARTEADISALLCRNERVAFQLMLEEGRLCLVMVGALIVAGISTRYLSPHTRNSGLRRPVVRRDCRERLNRGLELGRFRMGSTVVLLLTEDAGELAGLEPGRGVRVGEAIGMLGKARR